MTLLRDPRQFIGWPACRSPGERVRCAGLGNFWRVEGGSSCGVGLCWTLTGIVEPLGLGWLTAVARLRYDNQKVLNVQGYGRARDC